MMKSKKFWFSAAICATLTTGILGHTSILRWKIKEKVPGVEFQDSSLSLSGITFTGVTVDRPWVKGRLDMVTTDFSGENINIEGGSLTVDMDLKPQGQGDGESHHRKIEFKDLELQVKKGDHRFSLSGVRSDEQKVCFSGGKLDVPTVSTGDGCFNRENDTITVGQATLEELKISSAAVQNLVAHNIRYNTKEKTAQVGDVELKVKFEKQVFMIQASDVKASRKPDTVTLGGLKVKHPWLASDWISMENVEVRHTDRWEIKSKTSTVKVEPETLTISGEETCSSWIDSLPSNLKSPPLDKLVMNGKTSFSIGFRPKPTFNLRSDCRATCSSLPNLRKPFTYSAFTPKGEKFSRESGPGSKGWVPLRMMGDMPLAVTTMEDPGFEHHRGFITQAFFNSFTDNLKQGRFLRGGSTITMQLAKNLWLNRDKTLGRKIQEFFLAQSLESCYSKDDIMELYLNVIEFGPNQYGIGSGAQHWFKKGPGELVPPEAFWLASILPKPSRTPPPTDEALKRIEGLMKRFADDGKIPEFMLETTSDEFETGANEEQNVVP